MAGIPTLDVSVSPLHGVNRYIKEIRRPFARFLAVDADQSIDVADRHWREIEFAGAGVLPASADGLE